MRTPIHQGHVDGIGFFAQWQRQFQSQRFSCDAVPTSAADLSTTIAGKIVAMEFVSESHRFRRFKFSRRRESQQ